jgi:carboxymethylenebutenolidase
VLPDEVATLGAAGSPGVLLLHPWWGVTPAVHWWAEQLASAGRRVVVPDLFGGATPGTVEEAEAHAQAAIADPAVGTLLDRCADGLAGDGVPWAAMGFSLGAFLACRLAGADELVLFYGGQPPGGADLRPHRVELHVVPDDEFLTPGELDEVETGFRAAGAEVVVHRYEGCGHWFAEPGWPAYDAAAASLARDRVVDRLRVRR